MSRCDRVRILCEDRLSERFLRRLCEAHKMRVLDVQVAPVGKGAASAWVCANYPGLVKKSRSKNFQANLGFLVHVDGDNLGVAARKAEFDGRLAAANVAERGAGERIALLVPTWCIETWLLHLAALAAPPEDAKLKPVPDPAWRDALAKLEESDSALGAAVTAWHSLASAPPSLVDARVEAKRIGII